MYEATPGNLNDTQTAANTGAGKLCALLAEFDSPDALKAAATRVRGAGFTRWDAHTPFPVHGIDECMGTRPTKLPWLVFACGFIGCLTALLLQWWTNAAGPDEFGFVPTFLQGYPFLVSGKPYFSLPANIPVIFELTVLFAALGAGLGMFVFNNLPRYHNPIFASRRFHRVTTDAFFIRIDAADPLFDAAETRKLLEALGPAGIEPVLEIPDSARTPRVFMRTGLIAGCAALVPLAVIAMARGSKSEQPRIHIVHDMDNQEKYQPQQALPLFADGRAMRLPAGASPLNPLGTTVARGELRDDDHFYRGYRGDDVEDRFETFPTHRPEVDLSEAFIRRGQQRFNIYCAPCHGRDGSGQGMVNNRAAELGPWVPASNLHDDQVRARSVGHLFNTISNGIRTMPAYGEQIPEADRWAIVAYIRALQRSTQATLDELPKEVRDELRTR
ncbi:MAG: quinol:electron acceptor oxidoreductase subunit ActD [Phycisphaerae bacterium]